MTPDERSALDRQARVAATPEVRAERREPLPGQAELPLRSGWDLVTSRCLTEEQARKADELARAEKRESKGKAKGRDKGKGE